MLIRDWYLNAEFGSKENYKRRLKEDGSLIDRIERNYIYFEDIMIALETYEGAKYYLPPECFNSSENCKFKSRIKIFKEDDTEIYFTLKHFIKEVDNPNDYLKIINAVDNINSIKRLNEAQDKCSKFIGQFEFFKYIINGKTEIFYKFLEFIGINSHFNKNLLRLIPYSDRPEDLFFFLSENVSKEALEAFLNGDIYHLEILNFITYYFRIYHIDSDIDTYVKAFCMAIDNEEFFINKKYQIQFFVEDIISFISEKNNNLKKGQEKKVDCRYKDYSYLVDIVFEKVSNHWPEEDSLNLFKIFKDYVGNLNCKYLTKDFTSFYYHYSRDFEFLTSIFNQIR